MKESVLAENKRWPVLDLVKGIAVFVMIFVHVVMWWNLIEDASLSLGSEYLLEGLSVLLKILGMFPVSIPIMAGMAFWFFSKKGFDFQRKKFVISNPPFVKSIFLKAFFLIICGFLMNFLAFGFQDFFSWDALQFIAVSMLVSVIVLKLIKIELWCLVSLAAFFLEDILKGIFSSFQATYFFEVLFGGGITYFPFFRFYILFVFGFMVGYLYSQTLTCKQKFYQIALSYGLFFSTMYFMTVFNFFTFDKQNWWSSVSLLPKGVILGATGTFSLFIYFGDKFFSSIKMSRYNLFNVYGRGIFFIYIVQTVFGYHFSNYLKERSDSWILLFLSLFVNFALSYAVGLFCIVAKEKVQELKLASRIV